MTTIAIPQRILAEMTAAYANHGSFRSAHEAYGVIAEEVAEFFDEVRKRDRDIPALVRELIQIAACAQRFAIQLEQDGITR